MRNLANKVIQFTKYDDSGKWLGNGTGKVVAIEKGIRVIVSIRQHPLFNEQQLVPLFLWSKEGRYRTDLVIREIK